MKALSPRRITISRQEKNTLVRHPKYCQPEDIISPMDPDVGWELYGEQVMELRAERQIRRKRFSFDGHSQEGAWLKFGLSIQEIRETRAFWQSQKKITPWYRRSDLRYFAAKERIAHAMETQASGLGWRYYS